jgi:hypothetical protein
MKLKLGTIINSKEAFQELLKEKLPIRKAFKIKEVLKLIEPKFEMYEDLRSKLIMEKYGEQEGETGNWKVRDSMSKKFFLELQELQSEDIELDTVKIKLPDDDSIKITSANMYLLEWIIDFEEGKQE